MHGTVSEPEASNIRRRSEEGTGRKAERGALFPFVAVGCRRVGDDATGMNPDPPVREAVSPVFRRFGEPQGVRQVHPRPVRQGVGPPASQPGRERVRWRSPGHSRVHRILTNPVYAGAYAFGRRGSRVSIRDGRRHVTRGHAVVRENWKVSGKDSHVGYIGWNGSEVDQRVIPDNASKYHPSGSLGAVRSGAALLAGPLHCGHSGQRLRVAYVGSRPDILSYIRRSGHSTHGGRKCVSFGGLRVDGAIGGEIVRALQPIGVDAALRAIEDHARETSGTARRTEPAAARARHEADRAWRQYDAVDVGNRQVAAEPGRRWNERLTAVREIEGTLSRLCAEPRNRAMSAEQRVACLELGADLERAWTHAGVTPEVRRHILRTAPGSVTATVGGMGVGLLPHRHGGDHTETSVRRGSTGQQRYTTDAGRVDRRSPEPPLPQDGQGQHLERGERLELPFVPRIPGPSRRGTPGAQ